MICIAIGHARHRMMIMEHQALAKEGVELVEYRIDCIASQPQLARLLKHRPTPCIVTCRRAEDGGNWKGTEEQRLALLRSAIVSEVAYVDLEDDIAGDVPRYGKTKRIVSHHNFEETPDNLEEIHARMCELDPDIVKLVTLANSPGDAVRILKLVSESKVPTVGFCMGEYGIPSRILCGKYGSPFSFATFKKGKELAPGQLTLEQMRSVYHYEEINRETQVFGVIGDPIGHSLSPLIHNAALRHEGMNCVYLPFRIPEGELAETLEQLSWLDVRGYSVTIPHKHAALEFAEKKNEASVEIGAANTLFPDNEGTWNCDNTDYAAALSSIHLGLDPDADGENLARPDLQGKRVLMLGAGGVARAVGLGVLRCGAELTITNRTEERATTLAEELKCSHAAWDERGSVDADILVNCTAVGMYPKVDETPFPAENMQPGMLVFDTVYTPEETLLLKQAREQGCRTASGLEMFVRQAAAQFETFAGRSAPLDVIRAALQQGISASRKQVCD